MVCLLRHATLLRVAANPARFMNRVPRLGHLETGAPAGDPPRKKVTAPLYSQSG